MTTQPPIDPFDDEVRALAQAFRYPATPDLTANVYHQRSSRLWSSQRLVLVVLVLLAFLSLLAMPQVRAALKSLFRVGTVAVVVSEATPTVGPPSPPNPRLQALGPLVSAESAQQTLPFSLPTLPELGPPTEIYTPEPLGHIVVLVWIDPTQQVSVSLDVLDDAVWVQKMLHATPSIVLVDGSPALWLDASHEVFFFNPKTGQEYQPRRLTSGHTLIWASNNLTYRLELNADRETAVRLANTLVMGTRPR